MTRQLVLSLFLGLPLWAQQGAWSYVPTDARSLISIEWRHVLQSPQKDLVLKELPVEASQLLGGIGFIEGIDRVLIAQSADSKFLVLQGRFDIQKIRDAATADGGEARPFKSSELLAGKGSTEEDTQIAVISSTLLLVGDGKSLKEAIDRAAKTRRPSRSGSWDLWMLTTPLAPDVPSFEFALALEDGIRMESTLRTRSQAKASDLAETAKVYDIPAVQQDKDLKVSGRFTVPEFERRAGQWRITLEGLQAVPAPAQRSNGPQKIRIIGLDEGTKEIPLGPPPK